MHRLKESQGAETTSHPAAPPPRKSAPLADDAEKTIVVRDRRKPNQYTTDNVIAREWLPILRVGDAFFFYSVYLSMANRETESSWGSLRTQAEYLQCSVDLIVRGNKLLEICELVHIETGNQHTSNEYYILDPPSLTPDLQERIHQRLDDIARQETSKNWQAWVKQVRKALERHRALTDIWAARRARRGGRPVKAVRPDEEKGACGSQPASPADTPHNGNGDRESQPPWLWGTSAEIVRHKQGGRGPQPEQEILTIDSEQGKGRKEISPALVRDWLFRLGVAPATVAALEERHSTEQILRQLEWLRYRNPRDPAAMLVSAVQGDWAPPIRYGGQEPPYPGEPADASLEQTPPEVAGELPPRESLARAPAPESGDGYLIAGTAVDARGAWAQLLAEIRLQMTRATFDTWLGGTEVAGVHEDVISVLVRDSYAVEWLQARWKQPIERTLSAIAGRPLAVRFLGPGVGG
jgi:hypothetical protein